MDKIIVVIAIGIAVIVAGIFAVKFFYNPAGEPGSASTTASPIGTPPVQITPAPGLPPASGLTPAPKPASAPIPKPTTIKPSNTSSNALDRIEAAIRAKLKR